MYDVANQHITDISVKLGEMEKWWYDAGAGGEGRGKKGWSLSVPKDMVPSTFNGKDKGWLKGKEEITEYCEAGHPGLKNALDHALKRKEEITEAAMRNSPLGHTSKDWSGRHDIYVLLKRKTEATSDAKKMV